MLHRQQGYMLNKKAHVHGLVAPYTARKHPHSASFLMVDGIVLDVIQAEMPPICM